MEVLRIGNLTIRVNRATGSVEVDTNGAPWQGKLQDLGAEIATLLEKQSNEQAA
tara:strand:+ start:376 stop:537 length:162 start_codon:yes stop_codon:yes gene_type:complete